MMKYVIIRCEDLAPARDEIDALLEGAKTAHLHDLAQAGAAGILRPAPKQRAIDRFHLHRALLGLDAQEAAAAPAECYAAGAKLKLVEGETAWCCELVTHHDGKIVDPTAGNIPSKEGHVLVEALNEELRSDTRRWVQGEGSHHLLVTRDPALAVDGTWSIHPPELLIGQSWKRGLPKAQGRESLLALIGQASKILEAHAVNRVRIDLGENPANLLWLWGAAGSHSASTFTERTGRSGAMVSSGLPLRGLAQVLGLAWHDAPKALDEGPLQRLARTVADLLRACDLVYVHVVIDSSDPVERLCAMERIDHVLLKPMTALLPTFGSWRLLTVIDDRKQRTVPFVAIGTGVTPQPIAQLDAEHFARSPLGFTDGLKLSAWFTSQ